MEFLGRSMLYFDRKMHWQCFGRIEPAARSATEVSSPGIVTLIRSDHRARRGARGTESGVYPSEPIFTTGSQRLDRISPRVAKGRVLRLDSSPACTNYPTLEFAFQSNPPLSVWST